MIDVEDPAGQCESTKNGSTSRVSSLGVRCHLPTNPTKLIFGLIREIRDSAVKRVKREMVCSVSRVKGWRVLECDARVIAIVVYAPCPAGRTASSASAQCENPRRGPAQKGVQRMSRRALDTRRDGGPQRQRWGMCLGAEPTSRSSGRSTSWALN
jgi:hypothetical protein